jgi:hypothetical protein
VDTGWANKIVAACFNREGALASGSLQGSNSSLLIGHLRLQKTPAIGLLKIQPEFGLCAEQCPEWRSPWTIQLGS